MYLGLIEARYDYQLSYLDQWAKAWQQSATEFETFNIVRNSHLSKLQKKAKDFDLLVVLHSVSADSNSWLQRLSTLSHIARAPMVLFVGNEFSSPFLSTETRLNLISKIAPEVIASQIPIESARWLYEKTGSMVVPGPPGIPDIKFPKNNNKRIIDFGYRGFPYPWYLLDEDRNETIESVSNLFMRFQKNINMSYSERFNSTQWFEFLQNSSFTASSEAGSRFVFRDDQVWIPVQEYFASHHKYSAVNNDAVGMNFLRQLPRPFKKILKQITSTLGVKQASLFQPRAAEIDQLKSLINPEKFEHRNGKAISSRHFDAIACGAWQILKPGLYNNLLEPGIHYTPWEPSNPSTVIDLISDPKSLQLKAVNAIESLGKNHSYQARVNEILEILR